MRHLVGEDAEDAVPDGRGVHRGVEQQPALEEGDAAPILHGAAEAAGNRDQVELGQRILHAEIVIEIAQEIDGAVEREAALVALAGGGDDADGNAFGLRRQPLELAGREHEEIARHFRRRQECDLLQRRRDRLLFRDRHVADREEGARHRHGERERRLEGGLVPARKDAAGIGRLEMARQHPPGALVRGVVDEKKSPPELVDLAGEADAQLVRADGERLREGQRGGLGGGVERDDGALRAHHGVAALAAPPAQSGVASAAVSMVAAVRARFSALSTIRAVGSRTSMSTTCEPAKVRLSRLGSSSMA